MSPALFCMVGSACLWTTSTEPVSTWLANSGVPEISVGHHARCLSCKSCIHCKLLLATALCSRCAALEQLHADWSLLVCNKFRHFGHGTVKELHFVIIRSGAPKQCCPVGQVARSSWICICRSPSECPIRALFGFCPLMILLAKAYEPLEHIHVQISLLYLCAYVSP